MQLKVLQNERHERCTQKLLVKEKGHTTSCGV